MRWRVRRGPPAGVALTVRAADSKGALTVYVRRTFEVTVDQLASGNASFVVRSASDDFCNVWINDFHATLETYGTTMREGGHEFEYWNKEDLVPAEHFRVGTDNVVAIEVTNSPGSSDLYLDLVRWRRACGGAVRRSRG